MPIHSHCSIQPAPQAFYETGQIELVFIPYALKLINKFKIIFIMITCMILKDIGYYIILKELEMSASVFWVVPTVTSGDAD